MCIENYDDIAIVNDTIDNHFGVTLIIRQFCIFACTKTPASTNLHHDTLNHGIINGILRIQIWPLACAIKTFEILIELVIWVLFSFVTCQRLFEIRKKPFISTIAARARPSHGLNGRHRCEPGKSLLEVWISRLSTRNAGIEHLLPHVT